MSFWAAPRAAAVRLLPRVGPLRDRFWLLSMAAGGAGLPRGTAAAPLALIFNGSGSGFRPRAIFVGRLPGGLPRLFDSYILLRRLAADAGESATRGLRLPRGGRLQNNLWYVRDNQHSLHSVVARVEPELHDLPDHLGRETLRLR